MFHLAGGSSLHPLFCDMARFLWHVGFWQCYEVFILKEIIRVLVGLKGLGERFDF